MNKNKINYLLIASILLQPMATMGGDPVKEPKAKSEKLEKLSKSFEMLNQALNGQLALSGFLGSVKPKEMQDPYFPQCMILETMPNFNSAICPDLSPPSPEYINIAKSYYGLAENYEYAYQNDSRIGNTEGYNKGVQCLEENKNKLKDLQLQDRVNSVDELILKIKDNDQRFRQDIEKNELEPIKQVYDELYVGKNKVNDYTKVEEFNSPECKMLMNLTDVEKYSRSESSKGKGGYVGIYEKYQNSFKNAANFNADAARIKNNIIKAIDSSKKLISSSTLQQFISGNSPSVADGYPEVENNPLFKRAMGEKKTEYTQKQSQIRNSLSKALGSSAADQALVSKLVDGGEDVNKGHAIIEWRNQKDMECLYNRISGGENQFDSILSKARDVDPNSSNGGKNRSVQLYVDEVKKILKSNDNTSIENKIKEIKKIEAKGNRSSYRLALGSIYNNKNANFQWSLSSLLESMNQDCQKIASSTQFGNGYTLNESFAVVQKARSEIDQMEKSYRTEVINNLTDRVLTCSENINKQNPKTCKEDSFDQSKDFCFNASLVCANSMAKCQSKINAKIQMKKNFLDITSRRLNEKVKLYQQQQNDLYRTIQNTYVQQAKILKQYFSKNFSLPIDIELKNTHKAYNQDLGLELIDIDLANPQLYIDQMLKNLNSLKTKIENQNKEIITKIDDRIKNVKANYLEAANKWKEIKTSCKKSLDLANQIANENNKKISENYAKIHEICMRYELSNSSANNGEFKELLQDIAKIPGFELSDKDKECLRENNIEEDDDDALLEKAQKACSTENGVKECEEFIREVEVDGEKVACIDRKTPKCLKLAKAIVPKKSTGVVCESSLSQCKKINDDARDENPDSKKPVPGELNDNDRIDGNTIGN